MERDISAKVLDKTGYISTHTLTWSVTQNWSGKACTKVISTHTLTWSVTRTATISINVRRISTHTLTWSVTPSINGVRTWS